MVHVSHFKTVAGDSKNAIVGVSVPHNKTTPSQIACAQTNGEDVVKRCSRVFFCSDCMAVNADYPHGACG